MARESGFWAVWRPAAFAAIAPYILLIGIALSTGDPGTTLAWALVALSVVTLLLLARVRSALSTACLGAMQAPTVDDRSEAANFVDTVTASQNLSGLSAREDLWEAMKAHAAAGPTSIGVVRFANYPAMSAFNVTAAQRVISAFSRRVAAAVGPKRLAVQIDSHSLAILFCGERAVGGCVSELRSIGYVLAQEIEDHELTVCPDVHIGMAWTDDCDEPSQSIVARAQASTVSLRRFSQAGGTPPIVTFRSLADRFAMEQALRRAVREGQLHLHYQPFVDTTTGRIVGAEALLRWRHPTLGDVSPAQFVPLLEETGLVHEIGLWTLNTACRQLNDWRVSEKHALRLAINLSAVQLQHPTLISMIQRTVIAHDLKPSDIELELTETAAMEDLARSAALFGELRQLGFGIAVDDFGNGHSNLSLLNTLPFTKLKIDRSFVTHVDERTGSRAICKALIDLAHGLGISVLAEGVERPEEVQTLHRLGCNLFQGFYFARGMSAEQLTPRLADADWLAQIGSTLPAAGGEINNRVVL